MNETRMASIVLAAYFVGLARPRLGDHHSLARELQRGIEGPQRLTRLLAARPEYNAIGTEEVLDRGAFLEKLGVGDHLEPDAALGVDP